MSLGHSLTFPNQNLYFSFVTFSHLVRLCLFGPSQVITTTTANPTSSLLLHRIVDANIEG